MPVAFAPGAAPEKKAPPTPDYELHCLKFGSSFDAQCGAAGGGIVWRFSLGDGNAFWVIKTGGYHRKPCALTTARDAPADLFVMYDVAIGPEKGDPPLGAKCLQMQIVHEQEDVRGHGGGKRPAGQRRDNSQKPSAQVRSSGGQIGSTATYKEFRLTLDGDNHMTVDVDQVALDMRSPPKPQPLPKFESSPSSRFIHPSGIPKSGSAERVAQADER
jgi:hypothetical protein